MNDAIDRLLINRLQDGIDIVDAPFAALAAELGMTEDAIVERLRALVAQGSLSRFGPLYDAACLGGAVSLCAMAVPAARVDEVAALLHAMPQVAHNYEREHRLNMWFVLATEHAHALERAIDAIEHATGLTVIELPKLAEYRLELRLAV